MKKVAQWALGLTASLLLGVYLLNQSGLCFNITQSMPLGIYKRYPISSASRIQRGMLVSFCPPNNSDFQVALKRHYLAPGSCPKTQTQPLLKPVVAIPGDVIRINSQGIRVNGQLIALSQALSHDLQGRRMPIMHQGTYTVHPHQIWLVSAHSSQSFDSRYFGPLNLTQIQWIVKPLLIIGDY